jgi:hypothetical protein
MSFVFFVFLDDGSEIFKFDADKLFKLLPIDIKLCEQKTIKSRKRNIKANLILLRRVPLLLLFLLLLVILVL